MYLTKLSQRHGNNDVVDYQDLAAIVQRKVIFKKFEVEWTIEFQNP